VSAVWRTARAAVRRRRLQTIVVGVVVLFSTTMIVVALGLLAASSGPFDQAYARQRGAHLVVAYDRTKVTGAQLVQAAGRPDVDAVAGPFGQAAVHVTLAPSGPVVRVSPLAFTVVGRADPGGPVDRLNLWKGRWATSTGEIVINRNPVSSNDTDILIRIGTRLTVPGGQALTVVGFAYSMGKSADAWVTPDQIEALHPTVTQMLYRFKDAATAAQVRAGESAVTAGLPPEARLGSQSYLTLRADAAAKSQTFVTFLVFFGCLGLAVAVLIVVNVISGAVVAGFRHIGVLKALGFTPTQVMAVYLVMVSIPAAVGCVLGTVLGNLLAARLLTEAFSNLGSGDIGVALWVDAATLLGVPVVVALSALVPALRARSLSAAEAISAGSAPHAGRGLRIQRWLSGARLPRSVSLGLGMPFARPARSALTMAAVLLGVTSITFAIGLAGSMTSLQKAVDRTDAVQVEVHSAPDLIGGADTLTDSATESLLRSLPGTARVAATTQIEVGQVGTARPTAIEFFRGDAANFGYRVLKGHWPNGPGQVTVAKRFLVQRGLAVGDTLTVEVDGNRTRLRIVGELLLNESELIVADWQTLALVAPGTRADSYEVQLKPGTGVQSYIAAVRAANSGLDGEPVGESNSFVVIVLVTVSLLTLMLGVVAALGVFNTAVLNARERRRDLGMLKSIGMTPRQVTVMVVTSMAALGALGGLLGIPLGIVTHRLIIPAMGHSAQITVPEFMLNVYRAPTLVLLALAGIGIAALGAFIPARSAARTTIADVLHNE
jgi:putative ABC transport system permease protein